MLWPYKTKPIILCDPLYTKGAFGHDFRMQVEIFYLHFLSSLGSKQENSSAHHHENFLNFREQPLFFILLFFWRRTVKIMSGEVCSGGLYIVQLQGMMSWSSHWIYFFSLSELRESHTLRLWLSYPGQCHVVISIKYSSTASTNWRPISIFLLPIRGQKFCHCLPIAHGD